MRSGASKGRGFILVEVMVAVTIFAIGIIALGKSVENILNAERLKNEDARAVRALENAIAAIDAGAVVVSASKTEDLKGMYEGMQLKTTRVALKEKNEDGQDISGIDIVTVTVTWKSGGSEQSREITFYNTPRDR